jgi:hypothetical protein
VCVAFFAEAEEEEVNALSMASLSANPPPLPNPASSPPPVLLPPPALPPALLSFSINPVLVVTFSPSLCAFAAGLVLLDVVDCQGWSSRDNGDVCVNDSVIFLYVCVCV